MSRKLVSRFLMGTVLALVLLPALSQPAFAGNPAGGPVPADAQWDQAGKGAVQVKGRITDQNGDPVQIGRAHV